MAISEAQRRAVAKYNAANYERVELRLKKGKKDTVKTHADNYGESLNEFINRAIDCQIERDIAGDARDGAEGGNVSLSSDTLETAQRAAEATGETMCEFLTRAARAQAKRDEMALHMGLNPVAGEE